jgi:DSF synthase
VAERGARLGFPEPLLGLPGLFAEPLLTRRVTGARAGEVAASGRLYDAEDLHALGVVDVLAEQGRGEEAMRDALARASRRFNAQQAVYAVRRRVRPVTRAAVADLVERWIGAVMTLSERDLRNLDRLAAAQREAAASPARPETLAG